MSFKLSRIATKFERGQWNIHQFGYDDSGRYEKRVDKYRDYFYYKYEDIGDIIENKSFDCSDTNVYKTLSGDKD